MGEFFDFWLFDQLFPGQATGEVKGECTECEIEWTEPATDDEFLECPECGCFVEKRSVL